MQHFKDRVWSKEERRTKQLKKVPERQIRSTTQQKNRGINFKNHLGAERCALLTASSLKSKCPALHLGDLRGILLSLCHQATKRHWVRSLAHTHSHSQTVFPRSDGPRAAAPQALAAVNHQIWAAGARSRSVYLTVCPFSLYTKAEQIRLCAHRQHHHHHPHPTIIPPLTWLPMMAQVTPEFSVKIVMRKECHILHLLARCS